MTALKPIQRTHHLAWAKRELITAAVLRQYLLIDEHLNNEICWQFFPRRTYPALWQTKRFRAFCNYILDRLSLLAKLDFVRDRVRLPQKFNEDIRNLNALRNAFAHSFFPENRRTKPKWKGIDIFSFAGISQFIKDMGDASVFFAAGFRRHRQHPRPRKNPKTVRPP